MDIVDELKAFLSKVGIRKIVVEGQSGETIAIVVTDGQPTGDLPTPEHLTAEIIH